MPTYKDLARSTAATARDVAGASLTVAAGDGALFGSPTADAPMRAVVWRGTTFVTLLKVTGVTGDVLTIDGALGHADADVAIGDAVANVITAGDMDDLYAVIAGIALTPGPKGDPGDDGHSITATVSSTPPVSPSTGDVWIVP